MADPDGATAVVLTALEVESRAARAHLASPRPRRVKGTVFEVGWLNGTGLRVALAEIGEGNHGAAVITERAVEAFRPLAVVFAGVAGALKDDIALGDVVVATKVYAYHGAKEENGEPLARPVSWQVDHALDQLTRYVRSTRQWAPASAGRPSVHLKPVAAGEVVLNSAASPLREQLRRHYQDAAAIEMESAGFAHAAHLNKTPTLVVRGISDRADGAKRAADRAGLQEVAAGNAAALAFAVLRELAEEDGGAEAAEPSGEELWEEPGVAVFAAAPRPAAEWRGGEEAEVDGVHYLLRDQFLEERPSVDGSVIYRQCQALELGSGGSTQYVWLRQVETRHNTPETRAATRALAEERRLLTQRAGLPAARQFFAERRTTTLALAWPEDPLGAPCPTLSEVALTAPRDNPWGVSTLLKGLARLCLDLRSLHAMGRAHRHLTPSGIIAHNGSRLALRDLGLAAHDWRPGEGPDLYRAPEQRRRRPHRPPGPHTDVYQLAAVTYHLLAEQPPAADHPLPLHAHLPDAPRNLDDALLAALSPNPEDRPDIKGLRGALRTAYGELSGG